MNAVLAPQKQNINRAIDKWFGIHFGDTSFNGNAVIGCKKNDKFQTMNVRPLKSLRQYVKMIYASPRSDYYITANTVHGVKRRKDELFGLQNIVIDVDCHDVKQSRNATNLVQAFIWRAKRDLWNMNVIPTPNSIVYTGRGVQLWWAIQPCYGGKGYDISLYHHNKIKNTLMNHLESLLDEYSEELEGLSVDRGASSNPVGYFRMPCTYNTKVGRYGSLEILHTDRHDQRELTLIPDPEVEIVSEGTRATVPMQNSDREVLKGYATLGARRVMQLINLRNLRDSEIGDESRDKFNFSVYNALRMNFDHDDAMARVRAFNRGFKQPMSDSELDNCVCSAKEKGGYKYTNEALIDLLEITPDEQRTIGMFTRLGKPNATRDAVRSALKADRDSKIQRMKEEGISQVEIARILGIGKNTVYRVLKKMKSVVEKVGEIVGTLVEEECHHFGSIYVTAPEKALVGGGQFPAPIFRRNSS